MIQQIVDIVKPGHQVKYVKIVNPKEIEEFKGQIDDLINVWTQKLNEAVKQKDLETKLKYSKLKESQLKTNKMIQMQSLSSDGSQDLNIAIESIDT